MRHTSSNIIGPEQALPGRAEAIATSAEHFVSKRALQPPFPDDCATILLGMGCFWGAERKFWSRPGVYLTAVGYAGGYTLNPSYEEVCSGLTAHAEVVLVVYRNTRETLEQLLQLFWESHDPTQGLRQGNDLGSQYRSAIYCSSAAQLSAAQASKAAYQNALNAAGLGPITTEIAEGAAFYYAEAYHQQYLAKNPNGYCGLGGTGVCFSP